MKKIIYTLICGTLLCVSACRKYVEIPPENIKVLNKTSDYQQLLYNGNAFEGLYFYPVYAGDDVGTEQLTWQNPLNPLSANAYIWADKIFPVLDEDTEWSKLYFAIFNCNTVITGVMGSQGGTEQEKKNAQAEALVHRAICYYTLVNMYAKQYNPATASTDLGVPMVLEPKFTGSLLRLTVQKVYDQIKKDLNDALPVLADRPGFVTNPSKAAVYAIMARVCLNTREFAEAERYSELALSLQNTLLDLRLYPMGAGYPNRITNPEEIFFKRTSQFPPILPLSKDAVSMFDVKDLRYQIYTRDGATTGGSNFTDTRTYFRNRLVGDGVYVGPSVPEMMLIRAECKARADKPAEAVAILNELRKKRFNDADYTGLTASNGNEALHRVIDERKREFVGRGFRWFDQRRLRQDPGFINTVTRVFKGVTYTLSPESNRYTFMIADKHIQLNPEIIQNP